MEDLSSLHQIQAGMEILESFYPSLKVGGGVAEKGVMLQNCGAKANQLG